MATGVVTIITELMRRNECVSARIFPEARKENLAKTRGEQKGSRNLGRNEDPRLWPFLDFLWTEVYNIIHDACTIWDDMKVHKYSNSPGVGGFIRISTLFTKSSSSFCMAPFLLFKSSSSSCMAATFLHSSKNRDIKFSDMLATFPRLMLSVCFIAR